MREGNTEDRKITIENSASALGAIKASFAPNDLKTEVASPSKESTGIADGGQVLASKNGKRYYYPWCAAAERIAVKNRIYFKTVTDAEKAGLTPAANCKGMK